MNNRYKDCDIAEAVFDALFKYTNLQQLDFVRDFPYAELNFDFARIQLNDEFVIKVERI